MIKERSDGLLQKSWLPFPKKVGSRERRGREKIEKIREALSEGRWITQKEIVKRTGIHPGSVQQYLKRIENEMGGKLEVKRPSKTKKGQFPPYKYRIRSDNRRSTAES